MKTLTPLIALILLAAPEAEAQVRPNGPRPKPASQASGVNHIVQRGETLFSIAEKYYGDGYQWLKLKEYNEWVDDPNRISIGEVIYIPDPKRVPSTAHTLASRSAEAGERTSLNPAKSRSVFAWMPTFSNIHFFGRSLNQIILILLAWFVAHFAIQGFFVWFAAHLAFVKDVDLKKAMRASLQSESLALVCVVVAALLGFMLLYVGTTSPGKPVTSDILATAEEYLSSPGGISACGFLLVALYGFLGIRFIPPAFGIQAGRGAAVVLISILLPHLIGIYLVGHRMGLIE